MNELFLYDRDRGLFKEILKLSSVIEGRYFVAATGGPEINTANFGAYINDLLQGVTGAARKYPCCICLPPITGIQEEITTVYFNLLFLTRADHTGKNALKQPNAGAQVSTHHAWYDWEDMNECAQSFLLMLHTVIRGRTLGADALRAKINLLPGNREIFRITEIGNDKLNGVRVSFRMEMHNACEAQDYAPGANTAVVIPDEELHALHKH